MTGSHWTDDLGVVHYAHEDLPINQFHNVFKRAIAACKTTEEKELLIRVRQQVEGHVIHGTTRDIR